MKKHLVRGMIALIAASALGLGVSGCSAYRGEQSDCTVTGKYIAYGGKTTHKRVETSCGVFNTDDDLFRGHFNSADIYAQIQVNHTYNFRAYGDRNPFLSMFPNIESAQEVSR